MTSDVPNIPLPIPGANQTPVVQSLDNPMPSDAIMEEYGKRFEASSPLEMFEKDQALAGAIDQSRMTEAAAVAFTTIYSLEGAPMNLTVRASDPVAAGNRLLAAIAYFNQAYGFAATDPRKPPLATAPGQSPVAPEDAHQQATVPALQTPAPATASAPAPASAPTTATDSNVVYATKMTVEIVPGKDKPKVSFYADNHRFPDLVCYWKPEQAVAALQPTGAWTVDHFNKPAEYVGLRIAVTWVPSTTLNSHGNPYKNFHSAKPF